MDLYGYGRIKKIHISYLKNIYRFNDYNSLAFKWEYKSALIVNALQLWVMWSNDNDSSEVLKGYSDNLFKKIFYLYYRNEYLWPDSSRTLCFPRSIVDQGKIRFE